jgi:hypothetical protein
MRDPPSAALAGRPATTVRAMPKKRFRPPILDLTRTPADSTVIDLLALFHVLLTRQPASVRGVSHQLTGDELAEMRQKDHAVRCVCADLRINSPDVDARHSIGFCRIPFGGGRLVFRRRWLEAMLTLLEIVRAEEAKAQTAGLSKQNQGHAPTARRRQRVIDPAIERRDRWIYEQAFAGVLYDEIVRRLKKKPRTWPRIETKQGVRDRAFAYAKRKGLPEPGPRQEPSE